MKRFDATLEEAAFNLGASRAAVWRTITLPYLKPALIGAAAISFLMSFENFNTTLMLVGSDPPLTIMMYGRMREGASPVLNAVSLFLMVASAVLALALLLFELVPLPWRGLERSRFATVLRRTEVESRIAHVPRCLPFSARCRGSARPWRAAG